MNTDDVTRSAFGIALDAALRDQARATAAVEYLREKIAQLGPVEVAVTPTAEPAAPAPPIGALVKGPPGGKPTRCPDCGKPMGSVAGMSAHRRAHHPAAPVRLNGAAKIASAQQTEAAHIREVAAAIRAREPEQRADADAFAARREATAKARADAAWAANHPVNGAAQ